MLKVFYGSDTYSINQSITYDEKYDSLASAVNAASHSDFFSNNKIIWCENPEDLNKVEIDESQLYHQLIISTPSLDGKTKMGKFLKSKATKLDVPPGWDTRAIVEKYKEIATKNDVTFEVSALNELADRLSTHYYTFENYVRALAINNEKLTKDFALTIPYVEPNAFKIVPALFRSNFEFLEEQAEVVGRIDEQQYQKLIALIDSTVRTYFYHAVGLGASVGLTENRGRYLSKDLTGIHTPNLRKLKIYTSDYRISHKPKNTFWSFVLEAGQIIKNTYKTTARAAIPFNREERLPSVPKFAEIQQAPEDFIIERSVVKPKKPPKTQTFKFPKAVVVQPNTKQFTEALADIKTATELTIDLETFSPETKKKGLHPWALHPWRGLIRLMQIGTTDSVYVFDLGSRPTEQLSLFGGGGDRDTRLQQHQDLVEILKERIENPEVKIINHNLYFDLMFLAINFDIKKPTNLWDTMLGAKVLLGQNGGAKSIIKFSLKECCELFLNAKVDKTEQKSDWGVDSLSESQIQYAADDVFFTRDLYRKLVEIYDDIENTEFAPFAYPNPGEMFDAWVLENNVLTPAITMSLNGIPLDRQILQDCKQAAQASMDALMKEWDALFETSNLATIDTTNTQQFFDDIQLWDSKLKPTQKVALVDYVNKRYGLSLEKFDKEALADYVENPIVNLSLKIGEVATYLKDLTTFEKSASFAPDGRIHTTLNTMTGTGRFSSGNSKLDEIPNLYAISSKTKDYLHKVLKLPQVRSPIKPKDGNLYLVSDLSGSHAVIALDMFPDEAAITEHNSGEDAHSYVAAYVAKALGIDLDGDMISKLNGKYKYKPGEEEIDAMNHPLALKAKQMRECAKNVRYGWQNGAGPYKIQSTIKQQQFFEPPIEACIAARDGCSERYAEFEKNRKAFISDINKNHIFEFRGRHYARIYIPKANRQLTLLAFPSKNDPNKYETPYTETLAALWSSPESVVLKRSLIRIDNHCKHTPGWQDVLLTNQVYDEINMEAPETMALEVAKLKTRVMHEEFGRILERVSTGVPYDKPEKVICVPNPEKGKNGSWADK